MTAKMKRRDFITFLGGTAASWPFAARAQQATMPVVGFLTSRGPGDTPHLLAAVRQGLKDTGFAEGQNVAIEYRFAGNKIEQLPSLAADLVHRQVTAIVTTGTAAALAARRRPRPFRSSSKRAATRSGSASSPALIARGATSRA